MKKVLKRIVLFLIITIVVVLLAAIGAAALFQKQIGNRIIGAINDQINSELTVDDFSLSLVSSFPNVAANLNGVHLMDKNGEALLDAGQLSFRMGLLSALRNNYKIQSVKISNGTLRIQVDENGHPNYAIFKEENATPKTEEPSSAAVSLEEALIEEVELRFENESTRQNIQLLVNSARFSGDFSSAQLALESSAKLNSKKVELNGIQYLSNKDLSYNAQIDLNLEQGIYQFKDVSTSIDGNTFKLDGAIESLDNGVGYDLYLRNEEGNIQGVLQLLPEEYAAYLGDFSSTGNFEFTASLKGRHTSTVMPEISAKLILNDGSIKSPKLIDDFKDVSFIASFSNGKDRKAESSKFEILNLKGYFNQERTEMQASIENFEDPLLDFKINGAVPLKAIYPLFGNSQITDGQGELEIQDFILAGRYEDLIQMKRIDAVKNSGTITFDDAGLTMNGEDLIIDRGKLYLKDNQLTVEGLKLEGAGSTLEFKGTAFNLFPVLFADSLNSRNAELEFKADLTAEQLDIDRLLGALYLKTTSTDSNQVTNSVSDTVLTDQIRYREQITNLLNGTFTTTVRQFNYGKFSGDSFTGLLEFDNNLMRIKGGANAMDGIIGINGNLHFERAPWLTAKISLEDINAKKFFEQTDNFQQKVLTSENVSGTLSAQLLLYAYWDERGQFLTDRLQALAGIGIKDGALNNFELLKGFSTFVKIKDLQNIRLVNLQNFLEIRKSTLYIPAMFIQSNAMNLTISGSHAFDNNFEYNLKVNAGQVLTNRFKKYDPSLQPIPAGDKGFFNLHYQVSGNLENYQFKSAKQQIKEDFSRTSIRKKEIYQSLQEAFGTVNLIDEPAAWKDADAAEPPSEEFLDFDVEGNGKQKKN